MSITLIGDVHGQHDLYQELTEQNQYTVQLGDFGLQYDILNEVDSNKHKIVAGNHENYDITDCYSHFLGDFGSFSLGGVTLFFVRGGFSIDKKYRLNHYYTTGKKAWWAEEELSYMRGMDCLETYSTLKPDIVLSHSCPASVAKIIGRPEVLQNFGFDPSTFRTSTQTLLQAMLDIHSPKEWYFAHFHRSHQLTLGDTEFRYLDIMETVTIA